MTYVVTVETRAPAGAPDLDELQRVGVTALLQQGFDSVVGIEGPDGVEVDLLDTIMAVHPAGALLNVFVDASSLEVAEDAVGSVTQEVLEHSELLADWVVTSSEVKLHPDLARESLEAADGPDAPPSDLEARRAHHSAGADGSTGEVADTEDQVSGIRAMAACLRSFSPASFGVRSAEESEDDDDAGFRVTPEEAELAAGAIVHGAVVLIDELFDDVRTLGHEQSNVAECEGDLWHLGDLPPRYAPRYDELFARRFLVTVVALTTRFTDGSFSQLGCLAEELALKLVLEQAHVTLDLRGLLDDGVAGALESFAAEVYEDMDVEWLYDDAADGIDGDPATESLGIAPTGFGRWFTAFGDGRGVHPYAADEPTEGTPPP
ncbi:hypothetical protein ACIPPS_08470 [Streptomyces sp. NPDC090127]|uniref:hypothetical protein n=1 Tax=Streptomyces sp. NPDC090127 TaxID=3365953 RepID=UPI00382A9764